VIPIPDGFREVKPEPEQLIEAHVADPDLSPFHRSGIVPLLLEYVETADRYWQVWCPYCGYHRTAWSMSRVVQAWNDEQQATSRRINGV
jgi:hypothetical protein